MRQRIESGQVTNIRMHNNCFVRLFFGVVVWGYGGGLVVVVVVVIFPVVLIVWQELDSLLSFIHKSTFYRQPFSLPQIFLCLYVYVPIVYASPSPTSHLDYYL